MLVSVQPELPSGKEKSPAGQMQKVGFKEAPPHTYRRRMNGKGWADAPHLASSSLFWQSWLKSHILSASVHGCFGGRGKSGKVLLFSNRGGGGGREGERWFIIPKTGMTGWHFYLNWKKSVTRFAAVGRQTNAVYGDTSICKIPDRCHYYDLQRHKNRWIIHFFKKGCVWNDYFHMAYIFVRRD